mgnify:CR=1 FL=1
MCHVLRRQGERQGRKFAGEEPSRDGGVCGQLRRRDAAKSARVHQAHERVVQQRSVQTIDMSLAFSFFPSTYF